MNEKLESERRSYAEARRNPDSLLVAQDEWLKTNKGLLASEDIASCAVIAVYNRNDRTGYLGHFSTPYLYPEQRNMIDGFFETVKTAEQQNSLEIWASGCSEIDMQSNALNEDIELYNHDVLLGRHYISEKLHQLGSERRVVLDWLPPNETFRFTELDCANGMIRYLRTELPEV